MHTNEMNVISCTCVFKRKKGPGGNISSYKTRFVAQRYFQRISMDYDEMLSPVVRFKSVCALLAIASNHCLKVHHMDVSSAFTYGDLKDNAFMKMPIGLAEAGYSKVCKSRKSFYGLKQSLKCCNFTLDSCLKEMNFQQSYGFLHQSM